MLEINREAKVGKVESNLWLGNILMVGSQTGLHILSITATLKKSYWNPAVGSKGGRGRGGEGGGLGSDAVLYINSRKILFMSPI